MISQQGRVFRTPFSLSDWGSGALPMIHDYALHCHLSGPWRFLSMLTAESATIWDKSTTLVYSSSAISAVSSSFSFISAP
jgi:hypothetical protein